MRYEFCNFLFFFLGIGIIVGDFIEVFVFGRFFLKYVLYEILIGFVKINIGYLEFGVGVVFLIKVLLMMKNEIYVKLLYVELLNLKIFFKEFKLKVC